MKPGASTRLPRGQRVMPVRARRATLDAETCLAAIEAVGTRPRVPAVRVVAARDVAVLVLVARLNLASRWLCRLTWADVLSAPLPAIRLEEGGLTCLILLDEASAAALRRWRERFERWLGQPVVATEPLFPGFGHTRRRPATRRQLGVDFYKQVVRRRLSEAGLPPGLCSISHLGGALIGHPATAAEEGTRAP